MIGMWMLSAAARAGPPSAQAAAADASPASSASAHEAYVRGQALFSGTIDLRGRMYTHVADMPPTVVRCANCHAVANGADVPSSLAPRLTHDLLVRRRARRGGPPSNYDRNRFCTLLRRGVDPAFMLISVEMPRYTIDDSDCRALWQYLTGSGRENYP